MVHRHAELALPDVYFDRDQFGQYTLLSVVRARAGVGYHGRRVGNRRRAVYGAAAVGSALAALLPPFRPLRRSARQPEAPADDGFLPDQRRYFPANGLHRDRSPMPARHWREGMSERATRRCCAGASGLCSYGERRLPRFMSACMRRDGGACSRSLPTVGRFWSEPAITWPG